MSVDRLTAEDEAPPTREPSLWLSCGILVASASAMLAFLIVASSELYLGDLRVYTEGSQALSDPGLYTALFPIGDGNTVVPFIYPPFAAILFYPLHWFPFFAVAAGWTALTMGAMWGSVRTSLSLVAQQRLSTQQMRMYSLLWTALALWMTPVRHTLYEGQVSVFLLFGVLLAVRSASNIKSGLLIGFLAGVKLTPAVTGLYFLVRGRTRAALAALVGFAGTVLVAFAVSPTNTFDYFTDAIGAATDRVGGVGTVANQSLRGAIGRFVGYDDGQGAVWLVCAAILIVLAAVAIWRYRSDELAVVLVLQLTVCALSPLAWSHHWVWLVPTVIWLLHGPVRRRRWAVPVAVLWVLGTLTPVIELLLFVQTSNYIYDRPLWQSIAGACYPIGFLVLLVLMCAGSPRSESNRDRDAAIIDV